MAFKLGNTTLINNSKQIPAQDDMGIMRFGMFHQDSAIEENLFNPKGGAGSGIWIGDNQHMMVRTNNTEANIHSIDLSGSSAACETIYIHRWELTSAPTTTQSWRCIPHLRLGYVNSGTKTMLTGNSYRSFARIAGTSTSYERTQGDTATNTYLFPGGNTFPITGLLYNQTGTGFPRGGLSGYIRLWNRGTANFNTTVESMLLIPNFQANHIFVHSFGIYDDLTDGARRHDYIDLHLPVDTVTPGTAGESRLRYTIYDET